MASNLIKERVVKPLFMSALVALFCSGVAFAAESAWSSKEAEATLRGYIADCLKGSKESCKYAIDGIRNDDFIYTQYLDTFLGKESWKEVKTELAGYNEFVYETRIQLITQDIGCNLYMKLLKKSCQFNNDVACKWLGDEFHTIMVKQYGSWRKKYGYQCVLGEQSEAFKYYKKACDLGNHDGCGGYSELQMDISEIEERERDKTHKSDIIIRRK